MQAGSVCEGMGPDNSARGGSPGRGWWRMRWKGWSGCQVRQHSATADMGLVFVELIRLS